MALVTGSCFGQPVYVEALDVQPLSYGLFSIADFPNAGDAHWQMGVEWEPDPCGPASIYTCPTCAQLAGGTSPNKTITNGVGLANAFPFTVYGTFRCSPVGNVDRAFERAASVLRNGAERAVELELATGAHVGSQALVDAATVNITPTVGVPVTIPQGIALLEQYIGANSPGQGVILGARREILLANSDGPVLTPSGAELHTLLDTPVAALGGFDALTGPNGLAAPAGQAWLFALGSRPRVWRSEVFNAQDREHALNKLNNDLTVVAEQNYAVGFDCFAAGVLVYNGTSANASLGLPVEV